jgi:DNA replication protein DnaC
VGYIKNLKLNDNCFLNLNYNYKRIIGRNVELNNCIHKMKRYNNVCVCGFPGVGKKSFIQNVGKYAFERNMYKKVYYFELYYLRNADEILNNKKN